MTNYAELSFGSTPADEPCAQLGEINYHIRAQQESRAYITLLGRILREAGKEIPEGFELRIRENSHDFGVYLDVVARFDEDNRDAVRLAYWLEGNVPALWDDHARTVLNIKD